MTRYVPVAVDVSPTRSVAVTVYVRVAPFRVGVDVLIPVATHEAMPEPASLQG